MPVETPGQCTLLCCLAGLTNFLNRSSSEMELLNLTNNFNYPQNVFQIMRNVYFEESAISQYRMAKSIILF